MDTRQKGRGLFRAQPDVEDRVDLQPTRRHIAWLRFLNLHGALPSTYLFTLDGKDITDRGPQRALKRLWQGGYVYRPVQQRATDNANYHPYVYDLTDKGREYLKREGLWIEAVRPSGNWVHQLFVSCVTATMDLMCREHGYRYIPPHEYLDGRSLAVPVPFLWDDGEHTAPLAPDAVFAIDYGDNSFIAYALEADRNTEPHRHASWSRKSDRRTLRQYEAFIGRKLYKRAYSRDAMMMMLFITVSEAHAENFARLAEKEIKTLSSVAIGVVPEFQTPFKPPLPLRHLFEGPLLRGGREAFTIKKPAS